MASIEDLKLELWLRRRNMGRIVWTTRDGKSIPIKEMDLDHLLNTINYLERLEEERSICLDNLDVVI